VGVKRAKRKRGREKRDFRTAQSWSLLLFLPLNLKNPPGGVKRIRRKRGREKKRFPDSAKLVSFTLFTS